MRFGCKALLVGAGLFFSFFPYLPSFPSLPYFAVFAEERVAQVVGAVPQKVTLQFQGVDIMEILKLLAEQAGFNLVAGKNVSGRVTLFVKEVDPWEALEVVLTANELAYERRGQILTIMTQRDYELLYGQPYQDKRILQSIAPRYAKAVDLSRALAQVKSNVGRVIADEATNTLILMDIPAVVGQMMKLVKEMDQPLESRVFSLNYAVAKEVTPVLQEILTRGVGKISVDERTNQVVVTDYPAKLTELHRVLQAFDERSTQVSIEATIVQVTLSDKFQLGIDWEALPFEDALVKGMGVLSLTKGGSLRIGQASVNLSGDYRYLVEALRTFGDTRILSEPRLTVVNNQEAKILVGSREPYVTKSVSQTGTGTAVTSEAVTFLDVGIKLFVTPTITRDRFVLMKVRPEVSSTATPLTTADGNKIPVVETTEAETVLLIEDGGTVILGGLIKDEKSVSQLRIPLLGDMPVLGTLFRSDETTKKKTELVVLLRPTIITGRRLKVEEEFSERAGQSLEDSRGFDPEKYRLNLQDLVQKVVSVQASLSQLKGKVVMELTLAPSGLLQGPSQILESEPDALRGQAQQAILAASPYPPFPADFKKEPRTFVITLTYE